ncbi:DUF6456 domain-containing protein [Litorimonas sp.]|uniref:DUF6456 domain-containing protein n=1 Tax=Litorimonas sp. TaxID=1892381 RepID=UPI003A85C39A
MLSPHQIQILRRLLHHKAIISLNTGCDAMPARPLGDKRKRPVFWVPVKDVQALESYGALELHKDGYCVAKTAERRLKHGRDGTATQQHYDLEEREVYVQGGVKRKAAVNARLTVLDRLARRTDYDGRPLLDAPLVEAGRHFTRDYHASGHGLTATQRYDTAGVEEGGNCNRAEDQFIRAADAKARVQDARDVMGAGLDVAVVAVCCLDRSLESVERAESWASGSGLTILKLGLKKLSAHYGTVAGIKRGSSSPKSKSNPPPSGKTISYAPSKTYADRK